MAKSRYNQEFKLKVAEYYLENKHGYKNTGMNFNISASAVRKWVKQYNEHGEDGLLSIKGQAGYSGKFKQDVVEYMHRYRLSALQASIKFGIGSVDAVIKWERIYRKEGYYALHKGWEYIKSMESEPTKKIKKSETSNKIEEDLLTENERLRMENAYLKKLNALVQKRIEKQIKKK